MFRYFVLYKYKCVSFRNFLELELPFWRQLQLCKKGIRILLSSEQCCGSKYIEFRSGSESSSVVDPDWFISDPDTEGVSFKTKRWRDVKVTSTFANVDVTLTLVDVYRIFQNILTLTLESVSFKRQNVNVTSTFWKADPSILLVNVCVWCKHKQRIDLINYY